MKELEVKDLKDWKVSESNLKDDDVLVEELGGNGPVANGLLKVEEALCGGRGTGGGIGEGTWGGMGEDEVEVDGGGILGDRFDEVLVFGVGMLRSIGWKGFSLLRACKKGLLVAYL